MNFWENIDFYMKLKYGEDAGVNPEVANPQQAIANDFVNRVKAVAIKSMMLEQELQKAQQQLQSQDAEKQQAVAIAQQCMAENEQKTRLLKELYDKLNVYHQALENIAKELMAIQDQEQSQTSPESQVQQGNG
uniref:Uncharacterized protein n=1 Tax=Dictyoglomus turgidum TaxID=513050 RepID=A0A7C3WNZ7_9BACT